MYERYMSLTVLYKRFTSITHLFRSDKCYNATTAYDLWAYLTKKFCWTQSYLPNIGWSMSLLKFQFRIPEISDSRLHQADPFLKSARCTKYHCIQNKYHCTPKDESICMILISFPTYWKFSIIWGPIHKRWFPNFSSNWNHISCLFFSSFRNYFVCFVLIEQCFSVIGLPHSGLYMYIHHIPSGTQVWALFLLSAQSLAIFSN
jgi:hypothetical protein